MRPAKAHSKLKRQRLAFFRDYAVHIYIPHITVAFLKKGLGETVIKRIRERFTFPFEVTGSSMIYTSKNSKRHVIPLNDASDNLNEAVKNMVVEKFKHPSQMTAKIVVPKKTRLSANALLKHALYLDEVGGKYERHADGRHIFRVPAGRARHFYHKLYNTRGVTDKVDPEMTFY